MPTLREQAEAGTLTLQWRAVGDAGTCEDCLRLHGQGGHTLDEWRRLGLPATGHTQCRGACRCVLLPEDVISFAPDLIPPFSVKDALKDVADVADPLEAARIAINARLLPDFSPGTPVRYRGNLSDLFDEIGFVSEFPRPSAGGGVTVIFPNANPRFPEFGQLAVYDLSDLVIAGG